jgi:hypothetical protein
MLAGQTVTEAGKSAGMSRSAAYRIQQKEAFQNALRLARAELLEVTIDRLRSISRDAVDTLAEIATDTVPARGDKSATETETAPRVSASARVSAAREALAALFKGIEIWEIERRLAKLEQSAGEFAK